MCISGLQKTGRVLPIKGMEFIHIIWKIGLPLPLSCLQTLECATSRSTRHFPVHTNYRTTSNTGRIKISLFQEGQSFTQKLQPHCAWYLSVTVVKVSLPYQNCLQFWQTKHMTGSSCFLCTGHEAYLQVMQEQFHQAWLYLPTSSTPKNFMLPLTHLH